MMSIIKSIDEQTAECSALINISAYNRQLTYD